MLLGEGKETDWKIINYRSVGDLITAEYLHDLYNQAVVELNPVHFRNTVCVIEGGMFKSFAPQKEWDYLADVLGERLIRDADLRSNFSKYLERSQTDLTDMMETFKDKYEKLPWKFDKRDAHDDLQALHFMALDRIYAINLVQFEHALGYAVQKLAVKEGADVDKLLKSSHLTISGQEEIKALELSLKVSAGEISLKKAVSQYDAEFGEVNLAYGAKSEKANSSEKRIKGLVETPEKQREDRLSALKVPIKSDFDASKVSPVLSDLAKLAQKLGERRDRNKALMGRVASIRRTIMDNIAMLSGIKRNDLNSYFIKDVFDLLYHDKKLPAKELERRNKRMVLQRQEREAYGVEAISLSEKVLPKLDKSSQNIIGITASAGKVKGKVRRVFSIDEAKKVKKGEILVAYGTDFDLMVGLQNCAGVITEEGGLLSHASVISRELGKPCLINVKNAMSLFRDGQEIEIDSSLGVVRLLQDMREPANSNQGYFFLEDADQEDVQGSKAKNLNKLAKAGLPVLSAIQLNVENMDKIDETALEILNSFFDKGIRSNSYIVRSNADGEDGEEQSMAGQYESVECQAEYQLIAKAIKRVKDSYKTPKTAGIKSVSEKSRTVIIQPYYPQTYGGVAFSRHPVTGKKEIVIEASSKGAAAVVEGQNIENNLPENIKKELKKKVLKIEKVLGCPVDVEWGYGADGLKIFQARPIVFKKSNKKRLIVVAGGEGSRLRDMFNNNAAPFTKHFLPIPEKGGSVIGAILEKSKPYFDEIEISSSHNTLAFMKANFKDSEGIKVSNDTDMIGPLGPPLLKLIASGKRVYVCCGDIYSNFDWQKMECFHESHGKPVTILTSKSFPADKAACFNIDKKGNVKDWKRKEKSTKNDYINIGGYIIDPHPELVKIAKELISMKKCKEDLFFKRCIERQILAAFKEQSFSCNINTPDVYKALVNKIVLENDMPQKKRKLRK